MTLGQLRSFLAVARFGSVRRAAAALFVTEPSVSASVGALERELDVELLERQGRGVRLTTAGEELARHAREALALLDRGADAAREAARPGTGRLRLVAVTTAGEHVVPALLRGFAGRSPGIQPVLEVGNRALVIDRLEAREADLGIGGRPPAGRGIAGEPFAPNELVLAAAAGHPLAASRRISPSALSSETWLVREPGSGTRTTSEEYWASAGIEPGAILTLGSNGAVKQAAALGLGITLISEESVGVEIRAGMLRTLPVAGLPIRRAWHVLHPARGELSASASAFLRFVRSPAAKRALRSARAY
ncbi:MAG: LysR family transcriptional regulator [Actinomycetota bacterium]